MKIVVLAGSPHKNGTSNTLVNEFVRGAKEASKEVEVIDLAHISSIDKEKIYSKNLQKLLKG